MTDSSFTVHAAGGSAQASNISGLSDPIADGATYGPYDLMTYGQMSFTGHGKVSITPGTAGAVVNGSRITTPHDYPLTMSGVTAQDGAYTGLGGSSPCPPPPKQ